MLSEFQKARYWRRVLKSYANKTSFKRTKKSRKGIIPARYTHLRLRDQIIYRRLMRGETMAEVAADYGLSKVSLRYIVSRVKERGVEADSCPGQESASSTS